MVRGGGCPPSQNRAQPLDRFFCALDIHRDFGIDEIRGSIEFRSTLDDVQAPAGEMPFYANEGQVAKARSVKDIFQCDLAETDVEGGILKFRQFVQVLFAITITPVYIDVILGFTG